MEDIKLAPKLKNIHFIMAINHIDRIVLTHQVHNSPHGGNVKPNLGRR